MGVREGRKVVIRLGDTEVDLLTGDATKAKDVLGWTPTHTLEELCAEMVAADVAKFKRDKYLLQGGHDVSDPHEI